MAKLIARTNATTQRDYLAVSTILESLRLASGAMLDQARMSADQDSVREDRPDEFGEPINPTADRLYDLRATIDRLISEAKAAIRADHYDRDHAGLAPCPSGEYGA